MKTLSWAVWWGFVALGCGRYDERAAGERTALCVQNGADNMSEPYPSGSDDLLGTPLGAEIYTSTLGGSKGGRRGHAVQCPTRENRPAGHERADRAKVNRSGKSTNQRRARCESCEGPSGVAEVYASALGGSKGGRRGHADRCPTRENRSADRKRAELPRRAGQRKVQTSAEPDVRAARGPREGPRPVRGVELGRGVGLGHLGG